MSLTPVKLRAMNVVQLKMMLDVCEHFKAIHKKAHPDEHLISRELKARQEWKAVKPSFGFMMIGTSPLLAAKFKIGKTIHVMPISRTLFTKQQLLMLQKGVDTWQKH